MCNMHGVAQWSRILVAGKCLFCLYKQPLVTWSLSARTWTNSPRTPYTRLEMKDRVDGTKFASNNYVWIQLIGYPLKLCVCVAVFVSEKVPGRFFPLNLGHPELPRNKRATLVKQVLQAWLANSLFSTFRCMNVRYASKRKNTDSRFCRHNVNLKRMIPNNYCMYCMEQTGMFDCIVYDLMFFLGGLLEDLGGWGVMLGGFGEAC